MPDSPYTGLTAKLEIGTSPTNKLLTYVSGVDLTIEKDIIEVLQLGSTYKEKVPSIKNWSADVDGTCALADANTQDDLYTAFESGAQIDVTIFLNDTTKFTGKALVKNFNLSIAPDDKIGLTCTLDGNGALVLTYTA